MSANFSHIQHGCLSVGTTTDLGTIEAVSLTAYKIAGRWVAFHKVHGSYKAEQPLVILTGDNGDFIS